MMKASSETLYRRAQAANLDKIVAGGTISVLVVGKVGAGKSSTVNTLLRDQKALVSEHDVGTHTLTPHHGYWRTVPVTIYDTPGFGDAPPEDGNDERYLSEISKMAHRLDVIVLVTAMKAGTRSNNEVDETAMQAILKHFEVGVLLRSMVLLFTHADVLGRNSAEWMADQHRRFCKLAKINPIESGRLPVFSTGNTNDPTKRAFEADQLWIKLLGRCTRVRLRPLLIRNR
jgi:predicted GTPase